MRKVDPRSVRDQFDSEAESLMSFVGRLNKAVSGKPHEEADISQLASMAFLTLYVSFERFQSDLFLAYLNRDFMQFQRSQEVSLRESVRAKFGTWVEGRLHFATVSHIAVDELEGIVDPNGWNLTFPDSTKLKQRANEWLAPIHSRRVASLRRSDELLMDTAKSIRNFIAHESPSAKDRMNSCLASVNSRGGNDGLDRGTQRIHKVGAYLKAVKAGRRRMRIYADRLKDIAHRM